MPPERDPKDDPAQRFANTEKTFVELANKQRISIIFRLNEKPAKISQLAKDLNIAIQEVHRHVKRLQPAGLIEKNPDGIFSLTTFGNTITKQIPTLNYLSTHKEYFSDHVLGELPMKFVMRLGALDQCEPVRGIFSVLESWKDIYQHAKEYIDEIVPQVPNHLLEPALKRVKEAGVKYSYILPKNVTIPKGRKDLQKSLGHSEMLAKKSIERMMVESVRVAVVLNERQAMVMFPTQKGETDLTTAFFSENPTFHEWCLDYFRYRWYGSDIFDESKMKEV